MKQQLGLVLIFLWGLLLSATLHGYDLELDSSVDEVSLGDKFSYYEDTRGRLEIHQLRTMGGGWTESTENELNFGYNDSAYWLKVSIANLSKAPVEKFFVISYPLLDHIDIYEFSNFSDARHTSMGDSLVFDRRPVDNRFFISPLSWGAGEVKEIYLRVETSSAVKFPVRLVSKDAFYIQEQSDLIILGLYYGTMLMMAMYSFFVFFISRDKNYLFFVFYIVGLNAVFLAINGLSFQYFWPGSVDWNERVIINGSAIAIFFGSLFTFNVFNMNEGSGIKSVMLKFFMMSALALFVASFLLPYGYLIRPTIAFGLVASFLSIGLGVLSLLEGNSLAIYFIMSRIALCLGLAVLALHNFNIIPAYYVTGFAAQIGAVTEVLIASFALAERLNVEKDKGYLVKEELLSSERKERMAQAEILNTQRKANENLESKVKERTVALERANQKLLELSSTDQLTGLKNRRFFDSEISGEYVRAYRYQRSISMMIIDIDHFKGFNDHFGHLIGDECLKTVSRVISGAIKRPTDSVARFGGEEFCVVLPEVDVNGAMAVAEAIRHAVEVNEFRVNKEVVSITVSIGVACCIPMEPEGYNSLIETADTALYQSKNDGRNRVSSKACPAGPQATL